MTNFTCKRCGYECAQKNILLRHLNRKFKCAPTLSDISVETLVSELNENKGKYMCRFCNKCYNNPQSKYQHQRKCGQVYRLPDVKEDMPDIFRKMLVSEFDKFKTEWLQMQEAAITKTTTNHSINNTSINNGTVNNTNNTHTTNNITMNVQLRDFGHENMEAIPSYFIHGCLLKNLDVRDLLENLHFDPNYPENHNVRLLSKKQELVEFYKNNKWYPMSLPRGLNDLIQHACRIFREYYNGNQDDVKEDVGEDDMIKLLDQLEELDKLNERLIKPVKSEITAMLIGAKNQCNPCIQNDVKFNTLLENNY